MALLIKSGTLITAAETFCADILIEGERIKEIGQNLTYPDAEMIDATDKLVLPGGVDVHTHPSLPMATTVSSDNHYSAHKAAAFGGTTTAIDFVSQDSDSLSSCVEAWHRKADDLAAIDFGFHMNITHFNAQVNDQIPGLVKEGITSVKVFMAYNGTLRLTDGEIFQVLRTAGDHGLLTMVHAENGDVIQIMVAETLAKGHKSPPYHASTRPAWGSIEAVLRCSALAAQAQAPLYVVHMNAAGEVDQLRYAREHGLQVMGETCPQYLYFTDEELSADDGLKWIFSPPLRKKEDNLKLQQALADGTLQVISTDHCPFFFNGTRPITYEGQPVMIPGKELGRDDFSKTPNGVPGIGDRLPILWSYGVGKGWLTPNQFVALNCTNPAKIFGLYPQKGTLLPGSDADVVIWDPNRQVNYGVRMAQQRTDYNLYEGWKLVGYPEKVYLRGHLIVDQDRWLGKPGMGEFIFRHPFSKTL